MRCVIVIFFLILTGCGKDTQEMLPTSAMQPVLVSEDINTETPKTDYFSVGSTGSSASMAVGDGSVQFSLICDGFPSFTAWAGGGYASGAIDLKNPAGYEANFTPGTLSISENHQLKVHLGVDAKGAWGLKFNGLQVLGPRLPAIADPAGPEDIIATQKAILSAMRQHGLIEPSPGAGPLAGR